LKQGAPAWHAGGQEFESPWLHFRKYNDRKCSRALGEPSFYVLR